MALTNAERQARHRLKRARQNLDYRRTHLALVQMIEAHEALAQAVALGLPVPNTSEELLHARLNVNRMAA